MRAAIEAGWTGEKIEEGTHDVAARWEAGLCLGELVGSALLPERRCRADISREDARITGRRGRSFCAWARDHVDLFR